MVFWEELSQETIEAFEKLLEEKAIFMRPSSLREYLSVVPLTMLLLPVAMSGRSYTSPHWRVVKLCAFPPG